MVTVCLWLKGMTSRAEELGKHQPSPGQRSPTDTQRSHSSHHIDNFFLVFATIYSHAPKNTLLYLKDELNKWLTLACSIASGLQWVQDRVWRSRKYGRLAFVSPKVKKLFSHQLFQDSDQDDWLWPFRYWPRQSGLISQCDVLGTKKWCQGCHERQFTWRKTSYSIFPLRTERLKPLGKKWIQTTSLVLRPPQKLTGKQKNNFGSNI